MLKESRLVKKKRTTRGKGKEDRMEWALVSKTNSKKILKWFGPSKPSKEQVAKEERRVHSFSSHDLAINSKLNKTALHLREAGLAEEASLVEQLIKNAKELGDRGLIKEAGFLAKNNRSHWGPCN